MVGHPALVSAGSSFRRLLLCATVYGMRKILLLIVFLTLPSMARAATDVTGTWNVKVVLGDQGGSPTFTLKQEGAKITGQYSGALGDADIKGTIKGDSVTLEFTVEDNLIRYEGKLNADGTKMQGTCDYGGRASGTFTATKAEKASKADH